MVAPRATTLPWRCAVLIALAGCSGSHSPSVMGLSSPSPPTAASKAPGDASSAPSREADSPAGGDRVLNVYNWADYIAPAAISEFEREYGIKVNYDVYDSNEILETKLLTGHSNYDVVVPSAYFLENQIKAGVYRKLDKSLIPNLRNVDPEVARGTALYDPGNQYAVDYMWLSTTGIAYNIDQVGARGDAAAVASWRMIFDPGTLARYADCGVALIDSPINIISAALIYLHRDPNGESLADLEAAGRLLVGIRKYVRYVETSRAKEDMANGGICVSVSWSGDLVQNQDRAREAHSHLRLAFSIPKEGTVSNFDVLAIPADAPHPHNAHLFINYLLRPQVAALNTIQVRFANSVAGSKDFLSEEMRNDPAVYPPAAVRAKLIPSRAKSPAYIRHLMRVWTRFKTGV